MNFSHKVGGGNGRTAADASRKHISQHSGRLFCTGWLGPIRCREDAPGSAEDGVGNAHESGDADREGQENNEVVEAVEGFHDPTIM